MEPTKNIGGKKEQDEKYRRKGRRGGSCFVPCRFLCRALSTSFISYRYVFLAKKKIDHENRTTFPLRTRIFIQTDLNMECEWIGVVFQAAFDRCNGKRRKKKACPSGPTQNKQGIISKDTKDINTHPHRSTIIQMNAHPKPPTTRPSSSSKFGFPSLPLSAGSFSSNLHSSSHPQQLPPLSPRRSHQQQIAAATTRNLSLSLSR